MNRYVVVKFLDGKWPTEIVGLKTGQASHKVVETMQRNYAAMGHQTGCAWQVIEGNLADAFIATGKAQ